MTDFDEVAKELSAHPGRYALAAGHDTPELLTSLALDKGTEVVSVGKRLTAGDESALNVRDALRNAEFLVDLDILFAPQLHLDPLDLLRDLARRQPVLVAAWPGKIEGEQATYSEPGRRDYYRRRLENVLVLRPRPQALPGPPEFDIERFQ